MAPSLTLRAPSGLDGDLGRLADQVGIAAADRLDLVHKQLGHLLGRPAGEVAQSEHVLERDGGESGVSSEAVDQVVAWAAGLQGGGDRVAVLSDTLVQGLPIST